MTRRARRRVVITGGSSGIGLATARAFAGAGDEVILIARDAERLAAAAAELGDAASVFPADVADEDSVSGVGEQLAAGGAIDILVNAAGQLETGPAEAVGPGAFERLMQVNFLGAVRMVHACLPLLRGSRAPAIVNVSSVAGLVAPPFMAAYAASKFALVGYTRSLRQEMHGSGIHIGLVMPGPVDTPMTEGRIGTAHYPLPPFTPIVGPEVVAQVIVRCVARRTAEVVVPGRLAAGCRAASAWPALADRVFRSSQGSG